MEIRSNEWKSLKVKLSNFRDLYNNTNSIYFSLIVLYDVYIRIYIDFNKVN